MTSLPSPWHGTAQLRFSRHHPPGAEATATHSAATNCSAADSSGSQGMGSSTSYQGGATAPLKLQRAFHRADGRCELPILHTAGGLVGGDQLQVSAHLQPGSRALLTSVAAQKVYGSIGRSRLAPKGKWACQELDFQLASEADLEWLPQELVMFAGALYEQRARVDLAPGASWLGLDVVRLGRTAAGEELGPGRWRSLLEIRRQLGLSPSLPPTYRWELVDRLELGGEALHGEHGMAGEPVFGSLVWAAPRPLALGRMASLLDDCRADRYGLTGTMACGALDQGLVARYRGPSTTAARHWFIRIWARIRQVRGLAAPELPRVWPCQETPLTPLRSAPEPVAGQG